MRQRCDEYRKIETLNQKVAQRDEDLKSKDCELASARNELFKANMEKDLFGEYHKDIHEIVKRQDKDLKSKDRELKNANMEKEEVKESFAKVNRKLGKEESKLMELKALVANLKKELEASKAKNSKSWWRG
ncbi:hypothetical protein VI817_005794 [Penicillium citrinum]|uniref:Uncharacterized protein n=1 Tax=Penicillium hetheringtonii TaxID=911720 RepID=A0AAD6GR12_9EURO|nr:hypothetical protein N7450_009162 [Penicillium hetheringtonii]KAK5796509.1 hypothetical protein VI817_005794 [Penicillium citrinum]